MMAKSKGKKRKRCEQRQSGVGIPTGILNKKAKGSHTTKTHAGAAGHRLLSQLYPNLQTLREYVLAKLPASSRLRRKKITSVGLQDHAGGKTVTEAELAVARLLDCTLVGHGGQPDATPDKRWEQWTSFSQKGDESYVTLADGSAGGTYSQSEIVDFVVWLLFSRARETGNRPNHLLCDGFRKDSERRPQGRSAPGHSNIPGLFSLHPNNHVWGLKQDPWPQLLLLLGKAGEKMMLDLLLDCAIFSRITAGRDNYQQLSGVPVSDLEYQAGQVPAVVPAHSPTGERAGNVVSRGPSEISLVRSRMLYARAALNARGLVHFGLRHIHVLNRFPLQLRGMDNDDANRHDNMKHEDSTTRVMMYMFPRQFGLHNVFTSEVDHTQTAQKFQDYTLREEEITQKFCVFSDGKPQFKAHIPKRLRGLPQDLVRKLQVLHARCSYSMLLQHYCPPPGQPPGLSDLHHSKTIPVSAESQQKHPRSRKKAWQGPKPPKPPEYSTIVELATPAASVSAFCQAVLLRVIPHGFWGTKKNQDFNKAVFLKKVDHFISLRRFEQLSLHEIIQDLRVTDMDWLAPPNLKGQKSSLPETQKRLEILLEFVYYIFDSILIPLIRSNFYVTESNVHKYRLFFFRHDTWRHVAEPAMTALKTTMFEEVKMEDAVKILGSRHIGFSQVRLLPKGLAMRPITNLRRRMLVKANNKQFLGPSINTVLGPVASMLKFEKSINPQRLGSAMFSVGDIYQRLKGFKTVLGDTSKPLYLAKVDVQGAFDSIPQQAVSELMGQIPTQREYKLAKHVEVKPSDLLMTKGATVRPLKKWQTWAKATHDRTSFREKLEESLALGKRNTVFVESVASRSHRTRALMALMTTHIQDNLVKMGKKFYRQKNGIPQGSVLSSTLCNYFYADLEQTHLSFLQEDSDSLLLRLIDDFLLITTSRSKAIRFVEIMQGGIADYGVTVNPAKTLVNFDMSISGRPVPRLETGQAFPYCGSLINPTTLSIWKNHETPSKGAVVFDSLTVEHTRSPGATFKRKLLNAFKIQSHLMFFDTSHNTLQSVLSSIFSAYVETANKTWAYARCLPRSKRPTAGLVIGAIKELMGVSYLLLAGKSRAARWPGYKCGVKKTQMHWLGMVAFRMVLGRKQAGYKEVLAWLDEEVGRLGAEGKVDVRGLVRVVEKVQGVFKVKY